MKVLLLKDTPKVGSKNDIIEVKNGYASNFLIPNGFAVIATPDVIERTEEERKEALAKREALEKEIQSKLSEALKKDVVIKQKVNEKGHLFAGIDSKKLIEVIKNELGIDLPQNSINLKEHIKESGKHEIKVEIGDQKYTLNLNIEAE